MAMNIKVGTVYIDVEPDVSQFSEKLRRKLQETDLGKVVEQTINKASKSVVKLGKDTDRTSISLDKIGDRATNFNQKLLAMRNVIGLLKIPALFAALGLAAQALLSLAAGAIAVVSALGPLAGLLIAAPAGLLAIAAAATTVKLSFAGVSDELKALNKNVEQAVSPAAKEFAFFLFTLQPIRDELRNIASSNLLPGIERGMLAAFSTSNLKAVKSIIQDTARSLGDLSNKLGMELRSPEWARALLTISETTTQAFDEIGTALIDSLSGFRDLLVAGQPLLRWLTDVVAKGIQLAGIWAENAAASGKAAKWFQETADITYLLGSILGRLWKSLVAIGRAAYPLGKIILVALNEELAKLRDWAESASGQASLTSYFERSLPVLRSFVLLLGALAKTFFNIGDSVEGSGLASFMDSIRTEVLPILQEATLGSNGLGEALLDLTVAGAKIAAIMLSATGPITAFAKGLAAVVGAIADVLANHENLAAFVVTLASVLALSKAFALTKAVTYIFYMTKALMAQGVAATVAGRAQWGLNAAMRANPIGLIVTAIQLLVVGFFLLWQRSEKFREAVKALFTFLRKVGVVVLKVLIFNFKIYLRIMEAVLTAASHLPFVGDKFKGVALKIKATREAMDRAIASFDKLGTSAEEAGDDVEGMGKKSSKAIVSLDKVLQGKLKSTQSSLTKLGESLADTFTDLSSKAMKAFDAETARMMENLQVRVVAYGKSWVMKPGDMTPAERELAALDAVEAKRSRKLRRDELNKELKKASQDTTTEETFGGKIFTVTHTPDKDEVKRIKEELRQLNVEDRRTVLQAKAGVERKAATEAIKQAEINYQAERDLQKESFEKELTALQGKIAKGKLTAQAARRETLALLGRYGVELSTAGRNLGNAFAVSLNKSMASVQEQASKTSSSLMRILELRKQIESYKTAAATKAKNGLKDLSLGNPSLPGTSWSGFLELNTEKAVIGQYVQTQIVTDETTALQIGAGAMRKANRR